MRRRSFLASLTLAAFAANRTWAAEEPVVSVWKDRNCGCCGGWVTHMRAAGFRVEVTNSDDMPTIKRMTGVPDNLQSCHTARVDGYVIEGHVPASDIRRLLAERPKALGLTIPGMPASAPGMDIPGHPYKVLLFGPGAGNRVFATH
jgi:hypothetical protein